LVWDFLGLGMDCGVCYVFIYYLFWVVLWMVGLPLGARFGIIKLTIQINTPANTNLF